MTLASAGVLLFRILDSAKQIFLVHPGGPYWARKVLGSWSIPKGIVEAAEDELMCARREFREETGFDLIWHEGARDLGTFRISAAKTLRVWAIEGDCDPAKLISNSFEMEWPPKSGRTQTFPEVDRGAWFDQSAAERRITNGQRQIVEYFYSLT